MCTKILLIAICCCLCVPVVAAETVDALSVRVTELEKANYVLHEDLARARIELNIAISMLQDTISKLDTKIDTLQQKTLIELKEQLKKLEETGQKKYDDLQAGMKKLEETHQKKFDDLQADMQKQHDDLENEITNKTKQTQDEIATMLKQIRENQEMNNRLDKLEAIVQQIQDFLPLSSNGTIGHRRNPGPVTLMNQPKVEQFRLKIENKMNGIIAVSRDQGITWQPVGHVLTPTEKLGVEEKLPPNWSLAGSVASTAVNSISIRTSYDKATQTGTVFYLLPAQKKSENREPLANLPASMQAAAIQTDMPTAKGIFGDTLTPFQGNPVYLAVNDDMKPLSAIAKYTPTKGDVFIISVQQLKNMPQTYTFENTYGGFVKARDWQNHETIIGQVLVPVRGIGPLADTAGTGVGRLSSSKNGTLDISVRAQGNPGGFRLVLCTEDNKEEVTKARFSNSCMVVSEFYASDPSWQGMAPLFMGYLHPRYSEDDFKGADYMTRLGERVGVEFKVDNGEFGGFPPNLMGADQQLPKTADIAMEHITGIRIDCPVPPRS